jgi:phosphoglycolate phosphatase
MYDCIKVLHDKGIKLAVVSNKIDEMTQKIVSELFLGEFSLVFGKVEEYPIKPDPTLTLEVIKRLGVAPQETAFIGDSEVDVRTAKNAGCVSVGVTWGFRSEREVASENPDYLLHNTSEVAPLILRI